MGELIHLHGPEPQSLDAWRETKGIAANLVDPALLEWHKAFVAFVAMVSDEDRHELLQRHARLNRAVRALNAEQAGLEIV